MNKKVLYNKLCDELDEILIKTGMRKICIDCSTAHKAGCCGHCPYRSPNGCKSKSLMCKLHLCWWSPILAELKQQGRLQDNETLSHKMRTKMHELKLLSRWDEIYNIALKNDWLHARKVTEQYFDGVPYDETYNGYYFT